MPNPPTNQELNSNVIGAANDAASAILGALLNRLKLLEDRVLNLENNIKTKKKLPSKQKPATTEVFEVYSDCFKRIYKTEPARNAMINRLIQNMIERIGLEKSKKLAAFYLEQRDAFFIKNFHPIKSLVHSCESLLARMETGVKIGDQTAKRIETLKDNQSAVKSYLQRKHKT